MKPPNETGLREWIPYQQPDGPDKRPRVAARTLKPLTVLKASNAKGGPSRVVGFNPK
jgi:hypothetical protein